MPSDTHRLRVRSGALLTLSVALAGMTPLGAQERPVPLDTIPIVGSRVSADLPVRTRSVVVLTRGELELIPARTVGEVLHWTLGAEVGARSPAQADLALRGAGFEQALVLVNGVRMSDPQTGHFDLNLAVPLDRVERIEILRGPASALYGSDAVGGVVNIVTRGAPAWSARIEGGSFGTVRAGIQGGMTFADGSTLVLSGERSTSDGHREGTDFEITQWRLEGGTSLAGGRLGVEVGEGRRDFGADNFYAPFPSFEATVSRTASLRWENDRNARVRVEPRVSWRSHDDDFILIRENPEVYRNQHTSTQLTGEVVVRGRVNPTLTLAGGGEVGEDRLESNNLGDRSETRTALFAEAVLTPRADLVLAAGGRLDHHSLWGSFIAPSLSAGWTVTPTTRLHGAVGRSFRGPSWTERHYVDPAHIAPGALDPEKGFTAEIGFRSTPTPWGSIGATLFRRESTDLIDWVRAPVEAGEDPNPWEARNIRSAGFRGVELEAGLSLGPEHLLRVGAAFLSLDAELEPGLESKYALRPLKDQIMAEWRAALPVGGTASLRGLRGRRAGEGVWHQVDLRLAFPLPAGTLYLDGVNLGDSDHADLTGNPVAGRAFYLGYRIGG